MLRGRGVRPGQADPPVRHVRRRRPHLLALQPPPAVGPDGPGREGGQVRPGPRFAEELAPHDLAAQGRGDEALPLLVGAVSQDRRQGPLADHQARLLDPGPLELLGNDHLLGRRRRDPVRAGVVRGDQAGRGQPGPALLGRQRGHPGQDLRYGYTERGVRVDVGPEVALGLERGGPQLGGPGVGGPQELRQRNAPPPVQVDVVLPGEPDAAEQRQAVEGQVHRRLDHGDRGRRRGQGFLVGRAAQGPGPVPHGRGHDLELDERAGALVLDRLERADHPPERLALLGVGQP